MFWFPKYLAALHGFDVAQIGMTAWLPFLTADAGNLAGGWFTGLLIRRGLSTAAARKLSIALAAPLMTAAIPAAFTPHVGLAIGLVSTATFGYTSSTANTLPLPADVFPRNAVCGNRDSHQFSADAIHLSIAAGVVISK